MAPAIAYETTARLRQAGNDPPPPDSRLSPGRRLKNTRRNAGRREKPGSRNWGDGDKFVAAGLVDFRCIQEKQDEPKYHPPAKVGQWERRRQGKGAQPPMPRSFATSGSQSRERRAERTPCLVIMVVGPAPPLLSDRCGCARPRRTRMRVDATIEGMFRSP